MNLRSLLTTALSPEALADHPALNLDVTGLSTNSQTCKPGELFIGMPGTRVDGGCFWPQALEAGAIAAIVSQDAYDQVTPETPDQLVIPVEDLITACAQVAATFYDYPARTLKLIGVTGTNGKTTTTHLIEHFLNATGSPAALLGTLYARWNGHVKVAAHTTPFSADLQAQLAEARDGGCQYAVMEVSSHALDQGRVAACPFVVSVFTNLTQDHLDYHGTMEAYFEAKARLFQNHYCAGQAVINGDDAYGQRLLQRMPAGKAWSYSTYDSSADLWLSDLDYQSGGVRGKLHTPQGEAEFCSPLVGKFNLENLLAALGAGLQLGLDLNDMLAALVEFRGVPGRMERVSVLESNISVIVDYAHTPDSLENLLKAARPFIPGRVICVFGCGGDRDRTKRPQMGEIVARLADVTYVTSDNPRTEDPHRILEDILAGIPASVSPVVEADRAKAIRRAILEARPGDGVLIAGKGHEDYQILGTEKIHFDDREHARTALELRLQPVA
jgi:UDP-N-acetylmuramoyl-L-alanyl-D-glutamate--2,6-diaminopimelate ligase